MMTIQCNNNKKMQILEQISNIPGKIGFYYKNLVTGDCC